MQYGKDYSLEITSEAVHYNQWIYDLMYPYLGTRVLELGAGIGICPDLWDGGCMVVVIMKAKKLPGETAYAPSSPC